MSLLMIWRILFLPLTLLYAGVVRLRNWMYDRNYRRTTRFDANVIGVGNLAIGGTGKTPMIDYLIRYYKAKDFRVSTLSRGYGRQTNGFRVATIQDTPDTIGDEPYMYWTKYLPEVHVAVAEERDLAIPQLLGFRDHEVVLLDDSFQHRRVTPNFNLLLTTYEAPFYEDYMLPSGRLREPRHEAKRADALLVTKCPGFLAESDQVRIKHEMSVYSSAPVYFLTTEYLAPKPCFSNDMPLQSRVVLISGMANPAPFEKEIRSRYQVKLSHNYRDHYRYKSRDIKDIVMELDDQTSLITTEKDMVKLRQFPELSKFSCYFVPIQMKFLKDESLFQSQLDSVLKNYVQ